MKHRQEAKNFVLQSFDSQSEVGTYIDERYIYQQSYRLSPPAQDEIENAKKDLITEGILDNQHALTAKGFSLLFPSNKPAMRNELLSYCRDSRARAGDLVMDRSFQVKSFNFTKQQKIDLDLVLADLVQEGFIDNNLCLTESGYRKLY